MSQTFRQENQRETRRGFEESVASKTRIEGLREEFLREEQEV